MGRCNRHKYILSHILLWLVYSLVSVCTLLKWCNRSAAKNRETDRRSTANVAMKMHTSQFNKNYSHYNSINVLTVFSCGLRWIVKSHQSNVHTGKEMQTGKNCGIFFVHYDHSNIIIVDCETNDNNKTKHSRKFDNCSFTRHTQKRQKGEKRQHPTVQAVSCDSYEKWHEKSFSTVSCYASPITGAIKFGECLCVHYLSLRLPYCAITIRCQNTAAKQQSVNRFLVFLFTSRSSKYNGNWAAPANMQRMMCIA